MRHRFDLRLDTIDIIRARARALHQVKSKLDFRIVDALNGIF